MRDYEAVLKQARTCANRKYCDIGGNCEYYDAGVCCQGGEKDILNEAADAIEELLRWRGHSFLRWEKENYKTPPTEVFHDRYYDAMQVVHAICNANPPDGVDQETFMECLAAVFREIEELPTIKFPPREVLPNGEV